MTGERSVDIREIRGFWFMLLEREAGIGGPKRSRGFQPVMSDRCEQFGIGSAFICAHLRFHHFRFLSS